MIRKLINKFFTFFKYICSSAACYIIDLSVFSILSYLLKNIPGVKYILISTVCARILSSFINFILNKNKVFAQDKSDKNNNINLMLNYYLLVIVQMFISAISAEIVYKLTNYNLVLIKFIVDCVILVANYFIQKKYIFNNKFINFKNSFKSLFVFINENKLICVILFISLVLHIAVLFTLGVDYGLNSDDASYIASGIYFKNNLTIIMHGTQSAQIMPGMTYLIALISYFVGEGLALMVTLKILWMLMGLLSILGVYKIVRLFSNKIFSSISAAFLLVIDFIWMDNTILTETPFMFGFIFLIYSSLMLARTKKPKYFYQVVAFYMFSILFKANIAPYPVFLIIYLLLNKYDLKLLGKQMLISAAILSVFFIPWIIRNYVVFDKFIPLTYGSGDPLLLGTYQGYNYPEDNEEEYKKYVDTHASDEMKSYINGTATEKLYKTRYYDLEKEKFIAQYRIKEWWNNDKISMLKSYLIYKPYVNMYCTFYWATIWGITSEMILLIRKIDIILTIICGIVTLFNRKYFKELLFLAFNYIFQIAVYSYTFAFSRYGQTILFIRFIIIGIGLQIIYNFIKNKIIKLKNYKLEKGV